MLAGAEGLSKDERVVVEVRRIRPEDAMTLKTVRLAALLESRSAFGSTYADEVLRSDEEWAESARAGSIGPDRVIFFAIVDDKVAGLIGGYRANHSAPTVDLVSMWTAPMVRRSGFGRKLIEAVLRWATELGATSVELWVTRGNNLAQSLYEAIGFRETGEHQTLPSDPCKDEIRMTLRLWGDAGP